MNNIMSKAVKLAEQLYKYYKDNRGSVILTLDGTVFVFKIVAMNDGMRIVCNDETVLYISSWGIGKQYYRRDDVIHILIHFFKLLQLNEFESALKLNAGRLYVKQLEKVYTSRESISLRHFDFKNEFKITKFDKKTITSKEKVLISNHPEIYQYDLHSYPDLGRGSIVANYYGFSGDISALRVADIITNKKGAEYVVIHKKSQDGDISAMVVPNKKVLKDLPIADCIEDKDITYLIDNDELDNAYSALFICNRVNKRKRF